MNRFEDAITMTGRLPVSTPPSSISNEPLTAPSPWSRSTVTVGLGEDRIRR
ncbi:hypothetical protein [Desulfatiferula olefinivorans]